MTVDTASAGQRMPVPPHRDTLARRGSIALSWHPRWRLTLMLSAPLLWLGLIYIVALAALLITALWTVDNIVTVLTGSLYQAVTVRTVGVALLVTLIDILVALPIAFFMAKVANARWQCILVIAVLMPLWASYLVKAYAWRSVLSQNGIFE